MPRVPIVQRVEVLRRTLQTEADPRQAAMRFMALVAAPAFERDADPYTDPRLARRVWQLIERVWPTPIPADRRAPLPMERFGPGGLVHGFVPVGLRPVVFFFFESLGHGMVIVPGAEGTRYFRFALSGQEQQRPACSEAI